MASATLDATEELLGVLLRPGKADSGTAADHMAALDGPRLQRPITPRVQPVIARPDSAGCSPAVLAPCVDRHVGFSVGHPCPTQIAAVGAAERTWGKWPRSPRTWI